MLRRFDLADRYKNQLNGVLKNRTLLKFLTGVVIILAIANVVLLCTEKNRYVSIGASGLTIVLAGIIFFCLFKK
jgi:hypothetical protein